ncbi:MAG: right-handed parallel beta-helix repeat-containing protein [Nitrospira sp.]|nr:right-handed parallel beta-helix repeat-containing protein [Nitrospira sp.]
MIRLQPAAMGACILASALGQAVTVDAATYYVATSGSDYNPGTSSQPWRTIAHAARTMIAGDTTYVRGGTYKEGLIQFGRSGTSSAPIKLLNASGQFPIIDFVDKALTKQVNFKNYAGYQKAIGWITIEGFEIRNGYNGLKIDNGNDITIRRNWIHHNLMQGIFGNGPRILIDRNRINHNGRFAACATTPSVCNLDHGIYLNGTAVTITSNLIYDNLGYGIQANGTVSYKPTVHPGPEYALSNNWVIANNTMAYQAQGSGMVAWGSTLQNLKVENNIFYENGVRRTASYTNGVTFISMGSTGIVIRNNYACATGAGSTVFLSAGATQGVNYTASGNIVTTTNPGFVNAPSTLVASPNFALTSHSPVINKGLTTTAKLAYDGVVRPQEGAYDVGAYEYYMGGTIAQLPIAPTSATAF